MLKNKSRGQNRQCLPIDCLGVERDDRNAEEISNGREKPLLVDLAGIEHLGRPGTAVEILRKLGGFFARFDPASDQKVDNRFADRCTHSLHLVRANAMLAAPDRLACRSHASNNSSEDALWRR